MPTVQTWGGGAQFSEAFGSGVGTNFQTASSGFGGSGGAGMMSSATPSFATTTTGFGSSIASVSGNPFGMQQSFSSPGAMMMPASNNTDAAFTVENVFGGGGGDPFSAISNGGGGGGGMSNGLPQGFASMTMSKSSGGGVFATAGGKSFATANFGGGSAASNNPFASQGAKTNASVAGGGGFGSNNPFGGTATPNAAPAMAASSSAGGFTNNPFQSSGSSSISNRMSMPPIPSQQPQQQVFGGAGAPFGFGSSAAAPPNAGFAASAASNAFANGGSMFAPAPFGSAQTAGGSGASFAMQSANTFGQQQQQQQQPFSAGFGSMPGPGHMSMGPGVGSPAFNTSPRMAMGGVGGGPALQVVDPLANVNPFAKPAVPLAAMPGSGSGGGIPMPPSAGYASGRYGDR
ncbi:hypothetical protein HDU82_003907 [Entophlyctis luteolus]|nr:hypothetical protein HDU82_003907 [Entophlyctis luteolus]